MSFPSDFVVVVAVFVGGGGAAADAACLWAADSVAKITDCSFKRTRSHANTWHIHTQTHTAVDIERVYAYTIQQQGTCTHVINTPCSVKIA